MKVGNPKILKAEVSPEALFFTFQVVAGVTTAESSSDPPGESLKSSGDSGDPPVELRKGKRCRVLFSYRPTHEDELELNPNELIDFICEVSNYTKSPRPMHSS